MQKYRTIPIITIDDDCLYELDLITSLWNKYLEYPNCVVARRCHLPVVNTDNFFMPYEKWHKKYMKIKKPSYELFATGVGGVLYPPNILKISYLCLNDIYKSITADDIFLKKRENDLGIRIVLAEGNPESYHNLPEYKKSTAL